MSDTIKQVLTEAIHDEFKSRAMYRCVIDKFGEIRPFSNIVQAEGRHVAALLALFAKYQLAVPDDDWDTRVTAPDSIHAACQAAVSAEIENAAMYDRLLEQVAHYPDIHQVLTRLRSASVERHLPAFQRCVARHNTSNNLGLGQRGLGRRGLGRRCQKSVNA